MLWICHIASPRSLAQPHRHTLEKHSPFCEHGVTLSSENCGILYMSQCWLQIVLRICVVECPIAIFIILKMYWTYIAVHNPYTIQSTLPQSVQVTSPYVWMDIAVVIWCLCILFVCCIRPWNGTAKSHTWLDVELNVCLRQCNDNGQGLKTDRLSIKYMVCMEVEPQETWILDQIEFFTILLV